MMKTCNKILFLDIDGVLNNLGVLFNRVPLALSKIPEDNMIDQTCIRILNDIVFRTKCDVVLSSSWRIIYDLETINQLLHRHGATFTIVGKTPSVRGIRIRGDEIKKYLYDNFEQDKVSYVIIDDDSDMLEEQKRFFHQVDPNFGLTENDACEIIDMFERDCGEVGESRQTVNLVPCVE